jgi:DNA-binding transcriptional LysR family regulator
MRRERLVWVGDLHHLVRPGMTIPLVVLPAPTFIREHIFDTLSSAGHKWTVHFESDDPASLRTAIRSGWGSPCSTKKPCWAISPCRMPWRRRCCPFPGTLNSSCATTRSGMMH